MATAYPEHPRPSCHALIHQNNCVLLVQRATEPFKGWWGLPGGSVELGETLEEAVRREAREETGLDIAVNRYLGYRDAIQRDDSGQVRFHYVVHYFLATAAAGRLQAGDDAARAEWIDMSSVKDYQVTDSVYQTLQSAGLIAPS